MAKQGDNKHLSTTSERSSEVSEISVTETTHHQNHQKQSGHATSSYTTDNPNILPRSHHTDAHSKKSSKGWNCCAKKRNDNSSQTDNDLYPYTHGINSNENDKNDHHENESYKDHNKKHDLHSSSHSLTAQQDPNATFNLNQNRDGKHMDNDHGKKRDYDASSHTRTTNLDPNETFIEHKTKDEKHVDHGHDHEHGVHKDHGKKRNSGATSHTTHQDPYKTYSIPEHVSNYSKNPELNQEFNHIKSQSNPSITPENGSHRNEELNETYNISQPHHVSSPSSEFLGESEFGEDQFYLSKYNSIASLSLGENDRELEKLSNLSPTQIQTLVKELEHDIDVSKTEIARLRMDVEHLERLECQTLRTEETQKKIENSRRILQEEKSYLKELEERLWKLKHVKTKYQPFPIQRLPQVILCSSWNSLMPQVAICTARQRKKDTKKDELDDEFAKVFTPEQLKMIEEERKWLTLECSDLRLQIAGVKGKIRVVSKENNVLKAIVEEENREHSLTRRSEGQRLPCNKKFGKPGESIPCPKFKSKSDVPVMAITISSTKVGEKPELESNEVMDIDKKTALLQSELDLTREQLGTLEALKRAFACLKEVLQD